MNYSDINKPKRFFSISNTCKVGGSDHHHLVSTMLNNKNWKGSAKTLFYRDHKKFKKNKLTKDLTFDLQKIKNLSYSQFEKVFVTVLENHVPLKKKKLRFDHNPFLTKALRKAIRTHSIHTYTTKSDLMTTEINCANTLKSAIWNIVQIRFHSNNTSMIFK